LENVKQTPSEELINEMSERQGKSETSDGWEDMTMGDKKPKKEVTSRVSRERRETKYSASLPLLGVGGNCIVCSTRKVKGARKCFKRYHTLKNFKGFSVGPIVYQVFVDCVHRGVIVIRRKEYVYNLN
jgi:hypothetical protein